MQEGLELKEVVDIVTTSCILKESVGGFILLILCIPFIMLYLSLHNIITMVYNTHKKYANRVPTIFDKLVILNLIEDNLKKPLEETIGVKIDFCMITTSIIEELITEDSTLDYKDTFSMSTYNNGIMTVFIILDNIPKCAIYSLLENIVRTVIYHSTINGINKYNVEEQCKKFKYVYIDLILDTLDIYKKVYNDFLYKRVAITDKGIVFID